MAEDFEYEDVAPGEGMLRFVLAFALHDIVVVKQWQANEFARIEGSNGGLAGA